MHQALRNWYAAHGRTSLPWRNTQDPYAIYLSEVMLQQTQVQTVLERYYFPFLTAFPTIQALAEAELEDVLKAWEGLGYYSRAANLHKAAKLAASAMPDTVEGLLALPGVGRNTAHAVAAFAYHQPLPVMEANVKRILYRVFAFENASDNMLWEAAFQLLDNEGPFTYNQAMMDIGNMVCKKRDPLCLACPLQSICQGKTSPHLYPAPKAKKQVPTRFKSLIVIENSKGEVAMHRRDTRFLHGLYGFIEIDREQQALEWGGKAHPLQEMRYLGEVVQVYSHFRLEAKTYRLETELGRNIHPLWVKREDISAYPLSKADSKVLKLLDAVK